FVHASRNLASSLKNSEPSSGSDSSITFTASDSADVAGLSRNFFRASVWTRTLGSSRTSAPSGKRPSPTHRQKSSAIVEFLFSSSRRYFCLKNSSKKLHLRSPCLAYLLSSIVKKWSRINSYACKSRLIVDLLVRRYVAISS